MLKLENISFSADTENGKKEILKDITLEIDGGFYCNNRSERRRKVNSCENNSRHISSERRKNISRR